MGTKIQNQKQQSERNSKALPKKSSVQKKHELKKSG